MPKYNKPTPSKINVLWAIDALTGDIVEIDNSKIRQGWVQEKPPYQSENWINLQHDQYIAYLNQLGIPEWDQYTEYQANKSYIQGSDGVIYKCTQTHTDRNPVAGNSNFWEVFEGNRTSTESVRGLSRLATTSQALAGGNDNTVMTPLKTFQAFSQYGLGDITKLPPGNDLGRTDAVVPTGIYKISSTTTDSPVTTDGNVIWGRRASGGGEFQQVFAESGSRSFFRTRVAGSWNEWKEYITTANSDFVLPSRQINTGNGLTGGGDLSQDLTLGIAEGGVNTFELASGAVGANNLKNGSSEEVWASDRVGGFMGRPSQQTLGNRGYQILPGGLIMQWGTEGANGDKSLISFPLTFPNNCFNVNVCEATVSSESPDFGVVLVGVEHDTVTRSNFRVRMKAGTSSSVSWFAIGN